MLLWSVGNFRVVLCGGDGLEAGRLFAYAAFVAADRWVVPDSGYGVGEPSDFRSGGGAATVSDFLRGRAHPRPATARYDPGS